MAISLDDKKQILDQIEQYTNHREGKSKLYEIRFYVDTQTAKERAEFFGYLLDNDTNFKRDGFKSIADLTFGSGNLTTHLLLDNDIDFETLSFNDKNLSDANNVIAIGDKKGLDILNPDLFDSFGQFDLVVFNPQLGGKDTYPAGILEIESIEPIVHWLDEDIEVALSKEVDLSECMLGIDRIKREITIHSNKLSKTDMKDRFKSLKIFNYFDIFYQSKITNVEGSSSNIVKFRRTLEKITHENSVIVLLGDDKDYQKFFGDFNYYAEYLPSEGKRLFVGKKAVESKRQCFERKDGEFVLNVDCKKSKDEQEKDEIDLSAALTEVDTLLSELKSLEGGELFVMKTEDGSHTSESEKKQKPFKNFLLDYVKKDSR